MNVLKKYVEIGENELKRIENGEFIEVPCHYLLWSHKYVGKVGNTFLITDRVEEGKRVAEGLLKKRFLDLVVLNFADKYAILVREEDEQKLKLDNLLSLLSRGDMDE